MTGAAVLLVASAADRWRVGRVAAAALVPLLPTPVPAMAERPVPVFISSGAWRDYVRPGGAMVPVPLPTSWLGRDALGWSAAAGQEFEVPEGYFLGPGPDGRGTMGPTFTSRTTQLVADARRTGEVPVLTPADRQAVRTDVAGWHGEAIVMRAEAGNAAVWETDTIAVGLRHEAMAVDVAYDGGQALEKASFNRYNAAGPRPGHARRHRGRAERKRPLSNGWLRDRYRGSARRRMDA
ncbi:hypothetical protein ACIA5C_47505 [Actinoplanes sp. NPDC051343]|uniref:hypothetical protein n=1 Tax=Actinoplanes sp. NPDC051343 TaxID=3363906 RepID=UPI0037AC5513